MKKLGVFVLLVCMAMFVGCAEKASEPLPGADQGFQEQFEGEQKVPAGEAGGAAEEGAAKEKAAEGKADEGAKPAEEKPAVKPTEEKPAE